MGWRLHLPRRREPLVEVITCAFAQVRLQEYESVLRQSKLSLAWHRIFLRNHRD